MKIIAINFRLLRTAQSLQLLMDSCKLAKEDEKVSVKFAKQLSILSAAVDAFDVQLKIVKASEHTDAIADQKKKLGKSYSVLYNQVRSMNILTPTQEMADSVHRLKLLLGTYDIKRDMDTTELLNLTYNVTEDLSSEAYVSDVKALGLEVWVKLLMHEHDELEKLLGKRTVGIRPEGKSHLTASRYDAEAAYRELVGQVNVVSAMDDSTDYAAFIYGLNQRITYNKQTVIAGNKRVKTIAMKREEEAEALAGGGTEQEVQEVRPAEESATAADDSKEAAV